MSERAQELAARFEKANDEFIAIVQGCTDEQWHTSVPDDGRSVALVAHHVAGAYRAIASWVRMIAEGQPLPPMTQEMIDEGNAQFAAQRPNPTRQETVDLLRRNGERAASLVRGLSDEQLDRTGSTPLFGPNPLSAEQVIRGTLLGHLRGHRRSIEAAL